MAATEVGVCTLNFLAMRKNLTVYLFLEIYYILFYPAASCLQVLIFDKLKILFIIHSFYSDRHFYIIFIFDANVNSDSDY